VTVSLASIRAGTGVALALSGAALALPGSAAAAYVDGAQIISADFGRLEQGDDTTLYAAISDDARYVAFETRARNFFADDDPDPPGQYRQGGIFRFDLATRALELVADGNVFDEEDNRLVARGGQSPSVSADGRYVAFSTAQRLRPLDTNGNVDVYVRDMAVPIRAPGAYDLVSARSGGDVPAAYAAAQPPNPGLDPGSELTRGEAISADGTRVAFRSVAGSDLAGPDTPPGQVLMRDRQANTTTLVTRASEGGGPAGGASGPVVLSGDGSTVAWTGGNAAAQTRLLGGENTDGSLTYYLWRRLADGVDSPTRRVTGVADVDDPDCPAGASIANDSTATGPCYGPLGQQEGIQANISGQPPVLSGDGRRVAFLTGSAPRGPFSSGNGLDLYSTVMFPGVSRKQGTIELTREAPSGDAETSSGIQSAAISGDGRFIGLTTVRTRFVLPALRFTGGARVAAGARELYVVDLAARTIERAARASDGREIDSDIANGVSLSGDAARVAFTSLAGNLFFGDGNSRADAFVVSRRAETGDAEPLPPLVEDLDGVVVDEGGSSGGPRLGVRARSLRDGRVQLTVRVPGAGELKSQAIASTRRRGKRGKRSRRKRTLAVATTRPRQAGQTKVVLRVVRRYRRELRRTRKLVARTELTYVAARGGRRLKTSVRVAFRVKAPRRRAKR